MVRVSSSLSMCQHHLGQALTDLQGDIAAETIADNNVHFPLVHVAPLDIADVIEVRALPEPGEPLGQFVCPWSPSLANGEQADHW